MNGVPETGPLPEQFQEGNYVFTKTKLPFGAERHLFDNGMSCWNVAEFGQGDNPFTVGAVIGSDDFIADVAQALGATKDSTFAEFRRVMLRVQREAPVLEQKYREMGQIIKSGGLVIAPDPTKKPRKGKGGT